MTVIVTVGSAFLLAELGDKTMLDALEILYAGLGGILQRHKGTLSDYAGDAMFAVWELDRLDDAPELAINFALEAVDGVRQHLGDQGEVDRGVDPVPRSENHGRDRDRRAARRGSRGRRRL